MAHVQQERFVEFVKYFFPNFFSGANVLEVGSLDVNGTIRRYFKDCNYTGIDIAEGPGVDVVCQGQAYDAPAGTFDTVVSCEAMEHDPHWRDTFENMLRLCKSGGLVLVTCAGVGRPEHGTVRREPGASPLTISLGIPSLEATAQPTASRLTRLHPF